MNGFFAENSYLVEDSCVPYAGSDFLKCSLFENCKPIAKIKSSKILGGSFGESTEKMIMQELIRNGAVETDINVGDLAGAREGTDTSRVFSSNGKEEPTASPISEKKLKDYGYTWQKNDHSVMIIGYGFDKKTE